MSKNRILGTLAAVDGKGAVRLEDRYDTGIDDLWSAITDPARLVRWLGEFSGDMRVGGVYHARYFASGWEGDVRVEVCEPPRRLRLVSAGEDANVTEVTLTADGDATVLVLEQRGVPLKWLAGYGAGNQVHVEDLASYLAGGERCDSDARCAELDPDYAVLADEVYATLPE